MKKRVITLLISTLVGISIIGCGSTNTIDQAAKTYEEELGMNEEEARELAEEVNELMNDSTNEDIEDDQNSSEKESEIVIDILPEIQNGKLEDFKIQIYDMVFTYNYTMTNDDVKNIIENSSFDLTYEESFDTNGNPRISKVLLDNEVICEFDWLEVSNDANEFYQYLEIGSFLQGVNYAKNSYMSGGIDFDSLETYDDVMAYINNLGLEEIDSTIYDYEMQGTAFEYINGQTDNENADLIISAIDNGGYYQTHGTQKIYLHLYVSLPFEINDNEDIYSAEGKYYATWLQIFEFEADGTLIKNERLADKGSICLNDGIYKFYAEPVVKIYMNY